MFVPVSVCTHTCVCKCKGMMMMETTKYKSIVGLGCKLRATPYQGNKAEGTCSELSQSGILPRENTDDSGLP